MKSVRNFTGSVNGNWLKKFSAKVPLERLSSAVGRSSFTAFHILPQNCESHSVSD